MRAAEFNPQKADHFHIFLILYLVFLMSCAACRMPHANYRARNSARAKLPHAASLIQSEGEVLPNLMLYAQTSSL